MNKTLTSALHSIRSLFPENLGTFQSAFNGEIKVIHYFNGPCLWVDGIQQSGPYIKSLWQNTIQVIPSLLTTTTPKILILGLGAGAMVPVLNSHFPKCKIIGVEIDPQMLSLAKKYFSLDSHHNVRIVQTDAKNFFQQKTFAKTKFDLIFFDLYVGSKGSFQTDLLEKSLRSLLPKGFLALNTYMDDKNSLVVENQLNNLRSTLELVKIVKYKQNKVVFCSLKNSNQFFHSARSISSDDLRIS